ncbi:MAG: hypothetical protein K0Q78_2509 [Cellvibrio sp.]|nr:hypothetical protein [Cellvibrio sp.]
MVAIMQRPAWVWLYLVHRTGEILPMLCRVKSDRIGNSARAKTGFCGRVRTCVRQAVLIDSTYLPRPP